MAIFSLTNSKQKSFFALLFSCFLSIGLFAQNDLSLSAETFNTPAATNWVSGENVVFKLVVRNDGAQNNTSVNVDVPTPGNMTFLSTGAVTAGTSFAGTTWDIGSTLTAGIDSVFIELTYQIDAGTEGIYTLMPEISMMTEADSDSTPANGILSEDDFASACVSVPVQLICRDTLVTTAPSGHTNYQWFKDNLEIFGATAEIYEIIEDGTYHYTLNNGTSDCPAELCCQIIAQFSQCAGLGDLVWYDVDNDGIKDAAETGISGVTVYLLDEMAVIIDSTMTDNTGTYSFLDLIPGDYQVQFSHSTAPTNYVPTIQLNTNPDDVTDSDADTTTGLSHTITLSAGEYDPTIDAGYFLPASLGDFVFEDLDLDGIQDAIEPGIDGVTVTLFNGDGTPTGLTTTTMGGGAYEFTNLVPGDYYVVFDHNSAILTGSNYTPTLSSVGGDTTDSDADVVTGASSTVTLAPGDNYPHLDAGYVSCAAPDAGMDVAICEGESTNLVATSGDGIYSWAPGTGLSCINCANPTATPDQSTIYVVTSYAGTACEATDTVVVTVNDIPDPDFHAEETCPGDDMAFVNHTPTTLPDDLTYEWNFDDVASGLDNTSILRSPTHNYANSGEYDVMLVVVTPSGCRDTIFETVQVQPTPIAQAGEDLTICAGESVQLNAAGGDGSFAWTPSATLSNATIHNPIATPAITTIYTVTVANDFGCTDTDDITVTVIDVPVIASVASNDTQTCSSADGDITVSASGTAGAIEYSINGLNYQPSPNFTNLAAGTYNVTVRYVSGSCPIVYPNNPVIISAPGAPAITSATWTDIMDCTNMNDGTITINATGGTTPYEYSINGGTTWATNGGSNTFTGLTAGIYNVGVRNADGSCQVFYSTVEIDNVVAPVNPAFTSTNPTECGDDDGRIEISADGGEGLEYSINGGTTWQSSNIFDNLPASAAYEVMIRYDNGTCLVISTGNMFELIAPVAPSYDALATLVNPSDCETEDGSITVAATAGTIAGAAVTIEYSIDGINWQTSNEFLGLGAGSYNVFIRNMGENCEVAHVPNPVTLIAPDAPQITDVTFTDVADCTADNGIINISTIGGNGPLQYSINGGTDFFATPNFTDLTAGIYNIVVMNADGSCDVTWPSLEVEEPTAVTSVDASFTQPTECGSGDGTITVLAQGGEGLNGSGLDYSIDNGFSWQSSNVFSNLSGMNYTILVRNNDGTCVTPGGTITLVEPTAPVYNNPNAVTAMDPSDCETNDGSISIDATVGTIDGAGTAIEYSIDGGINWQFGSGFTGLTAGVYNVVIRNENGTCELNYPNNPVTLSFPDAPVIDFVAHTDVTDCGVVDGEITINAVGGIAPLQYSIDGGANFETTNVFPDLTAGMYNIVVTNAAGTCLTTYPPLEIEAPTPVTNLSATFTHPTDCNEVDGTITVTADGSEGLEYSVNGGTTWQTSNVFINLVGNTYTVMARNADGTCEETLTPNIELITPQTPSITDVTTINPTDCDTDNGSIEIISTAGSDSNGTAVIEYSIDGGINWTTSSTFTDFSNGSYNIRVRNQGETCTVAWMSAIELQSPEAPIVKEVMTTDVTNCGADDGTITIIAEDGQEPYMYGLHVPGTTDTLWQAANSYANLTAGNYHIFVRNDDGSCLTCYLSATIEAPTTPNLGVVVVVQPTDCGESDGRIEITADGDVALEYSIDNGTTWQSSNVFAFLPAANDYAVWVRNEDGTCEAEYAFGNPIALVEPTAPVITDITASNPSDCDVNNGSLEITATGSGNLEYSIDGFNWSTTGLFEDLSNGTYNIFVRNEGGTCVTADVNNPIELVAPNAPQIKDVISQSPTECNVNDGFIQITAINGEGNLQYSIDGGMIFQDSPNFLNLAAGNYMVIVTNEDGSCMTMWPSVMLDAPELPVISDVITTAPTDCGESNGTLVIEASSSSTALEYTIDGTTWQSSNVFINLEGGDYDVRVRNVGGNCEVANGIVTIDAPVAPTLNAPIDNVSICENASTPISIAIDQDIIDFEISGNGGYDNAVVVGNTLTFDAFLNGTVSNFSVTLTGDSGCDVTEDFTVYETSDPAADFIILQPTCANDAVTFQFTGDASPGAVLTWDLAGATVLYSSPATATEPAASQIVVSYPSVGGIVVALEVNDGSCIDNEVQSVNISPIAPNLNADITDVSDCDVANGAIDLMVVNNLPFESVYTYEWSSDNGFTSMTEDLTGIEAGTYYVTITDQFSGCKHSGIFAVSTVPALDVFDYEVINNIDCNEAEAVISLQIAGGTAPFDYTLVRLDNGTEELIGNEVSDLREVSFEDLASGLYEIRINDAGNCGPLSFVIPIYGGNGPEGQFTNVVAPDCDESNGSFTLLVQGGEFPLDYDMFLGNMLLGSGSIPSASVETNFTELAAGNYFVKLRDLNGCVNWVRLANDCDPTRCDFGAITEIVVQPISCDSNDGSITLSGITGTPTITWTSSTGATFTGMMIENLRPAVYTATLDDGECSTERIYSLTAPDGATITIDNIVDVTCPGGSDGSIEFRISGNGWYNYSISNGSQSGTVTLNPSTNPEVVVTATDLDAGDYYISVIDNLTGCTNSVAFTIDQNDIIEIFATPIVASACYASDGRVDIDITGGNAPYTLISDVGDISTNPFNSVTSIENLRGGVVNITITDFNGCTDDLAVDLGAIPSCLDTVELIVLNNTPLDTCLTSVFDLPGNVTTATVCGDDPSMVSLTANDGSNCVTMTPNEDFVGTTELCVVHCDDMIAGYCDTTILIVTVLPPTDTVLVTIPGDVPTEICIDDALLQMTGTPTSVAFCNDEIAGEASVNNLVGQCVTIDPVDGFAGTATDLFCVVHCYDDAMIICDTTYIGITVQPTTDTVTFIIPPNTDSVVCLDDDVLEYPDTVESIMYCDQGDASTVSSPQFFMDNCLSLAPAMGFTGYSSEPICIIHCYGIVNGVEICDTTYVNAIVTPPTDEINVIVQGDEPFDVCLDDTVLEFPGALVSTTLCGAGDVDEVQATNITGNCVTLDPAADFVGDASEQICVIHCYDNAGEICDTTYINVTVLPTPDTIEVIIPAIVATEICLDGDILEFPGTLTDATFCNAGNPNTVLGSALNGNCLMLNPNDTYVGAMPTPICVTHCYENANAPSGKICDTTYIFVTVLPPVDTIEVTIPYGIDTEECIPATALQFPGNPTSSSFCDNGNPATVLGTNLNTDCLTLEPADGFFGTSTDLICVVNCYDDAQQVCDTTYIEVTVELPPCELVVTSVINFDATCGEADGYAIATVEGALGNLTYNWDGSTSTTNTITDLTTGMYNMTVTDDLTGCTATGMAWIGQVGGDVIFTAQNTQTATCEGADGIASISASQGDAPYSVTWSGPTTGSMDNLTSADFDVTGLQAGIYIFSVSDANGCATQKDVTIGSNAGSLTLDTQVIEYPACDGGNNGKVMAMVGNFGNYYSLTLDGEEIVFGISTSTFSVGNLTAGTYMLGVTDSNGCTAEVQFTLTEMLEPLTAADYIATDETCVGESNGSIVSTDTRVFTVSNQAGTVLGTTPMNNLAAGMYTLTYTVGQCSTLENVFIAQNAGMTFTPTIMQESCTGNDGSIIANASGGIAPYTYVWSTGNTTGGMNGLTAGTYSLTATDANGCTAMSGGIVVEDGCTFAPPTPMTLTTTIPYETMTQYCLSDEAMDYPATPTSQEWCNFGDTDEVMGMNLADDCFMLDASQGFMGETSEPLCIVICYYNGTEICDTTYLRVIVDQPVCDLQLNGVAKTDASCGENNGSAQVMTNGGTAPYIYTWLPNVSTTAFASDLGQGTYSVTVTDAMGCEVTGSVTINNGQAISLNLTAESATCEANDGAINVDIIGGTSEYSITWSGPVSGDVSGIVTTAYTLDNLLAGDYSLTVTDAQGCATTGTRIVGLSAGNLNVTATVMQQPECGVDNGEISITVIDDEPFALYVDGLLIGENIISPHIISELEGGVHTIEVTSAAGCEANTNIILNEEDADVLNTSDVNVGNVSCSSGSDGSISSGLSTELEVFLGAQNMGQTPLDNLTAGTYTIVLYTGTCESSVQVTITQPELMSLSVATTDETCENNDGTITAMMTGGTEPYVYSWSSGDMITNMVNVPAGIYSLLVTDANGCTAALSGITVDLDCTPEDPCEEIFTEETYEATANTAGNANVCVDVINGLASDYDLALDGLAYTDDLTSCGQDTTIFYSYALVYQQAQNGPYEVKWTINGTDHVGVFQNPTELTVWMNSVNPSPEWYLDAGDAAIKGLGNPQGYGTMVVKHQLTQIVAMLQVNYATTLSSEGIVVNGMGDHMLIATDPSTGCTDTLFITVVDGVTDPVSEECDDLIADTFVSIENSDCNAMADFCSGIPIQEILEYDITDNGALYTGELSGCGYESIYRYNYFSIPGQCSDGPYDLNDWTINGVSNSGTFNNINELISLLNGWDANGNWTVDPYTFTIVGGDLNNDYGEMVIRHNTSGFTSSIAPHIGLQASSANLGLTVGTHELIFTHYLTDCTDTVTVEVTCPAQDITTTTSTIERTIFNGEQEPICLEVGELPGTLVSIENVCPESGGDNVTFELAGANCLIATGESSGTGSACIVICDDQGICDTTIIIINVEASILLPPVSQIDLPDGDDEDDTTIADERADEETAINETPEVIVYSGFSPNGDGVNDYFTIEGLENYPNHRLKIFNRAGNTVFGSVDYRNDWDGSYNGQVLTGTYFYVIETGDGNRVSGYIHIKTN